MMRYLPTVLMSTVLLTGGAPTDGDRSCRTMADCASGWRCLAPGEFLGCGTCYAAYDCDSDLACRSLGEEFICAQVGCSCGPICTPGCVSDSGCAPSESCGLDHRCAPRACLLDEDCPINFDCTGSDDRRCLRKSCIADDQCDGFCVQHSCYESLGTCAAMPM